jgi:hypothetical protein
VGLFRYAESKAPQTGSFPGVGGLGTLQCAAPTMLDRAIGGDCSLLNNGAPGKDGDSSVASAEGAPWPCNHSWPRELMQETLGEIKMIKTFAIALVCVASVVSIAQAQTSGSAGAGASVGAGRTGTGITAGSSVVTPPASTGVGVSGGTSGPTSQPAQPSIDTNRAQQPGIGVNGGAGVGR